MLRRERVPAFLGRNFEPFSRYLAIRCTSRPETSSSCSLTPTLPTLPRAASAVPEPCLVAVGFLEDSMLLSRARHTYTRYIYISDSSVRDNYFFGPCDLNMSMSGRFLARR